MHSVQTASAHSVDMPCQFGRIVLYPGLYTRFTFPITVRVSGIRFLGATVSDGTQKNARLFVF